MNASQPSISQPEHPLDLDPRILEHGPKTGETILFLHGGNMAGWTWYGQVGRLPDRHILTPDMPGYGSRTDEQWVSAAATADDIAELIRDRALDRKAHVVGLSLGGFVAVQLLHRHPELVRSCIVSGSALTGYSRFERATVRMQLPLWRQRWYWAAQAALFQIPADSRKLFAGDGSSPSAETNRAMARDILHGGLPAGGFRYPGPLLAVAGERDTPSVRAAFPALRAALPQTRTWVVPKMHHAWNAEDPELFTEMVTKFADSGEWEWAE
ncbi:MAG: alpha/beta fold hydrolase [Gulosibacter sp.]|uniref:alpha/beta fold hydrolase n=1 Tax=Gulosibacter sp. TaxID=2817531 RepID=UPI003F92886B